MERCSNGISPLCKGGCRLFDICVRIAYAPPRIKMKVENRNMYITQTIVYKQTHERTIDIYEEDINSLTQEVRKHLRGNVNPSDIEITMSDIMNCVERSESFVSPLDEKLYLPLRHYIKIWLEDKFDYEPL